MDTLTRGVTGNNIVIIISKIGFGPVAPADRAWRGCYFSLQLKCYMIVYVDDFKIAGPKDNVKAAWELIRGPNPRAKERGIVLDNPTPAGKVLGCNHEVSYVWGPPTRADRESLQLLTNVQITNIVDGAPFPEITRVAQDSLVTNAAPCSEVTEVAQGLLVTNATDPKTNRNDADLIRRPQGAPIAMCLLDGTAGVPIENNPTIMCSLDGAAGVVITDRLSTMWSLDDAAGSLCDGEVATMCPAEDATGAHAGQIGGDVEDGGPGYLPSSGARDPATGYVCCKQIKYDMSDFLGSCARLCKDLANA
jgi:hypothetical protein